MPRPATRTTSSAARIAQAAAAAAVAAALLPAAALAESVVYVDGGNVWSATPDGARKVQLTDGGNWHSPTQADDGTIAAVQGTGPIVVMARDGRPLHTITTAPAPTSNGGTFAPRPVQLAFTPDGSRLAYAYTGLSCPPASTCGGQVSTFYTDAGVTTATPPSTWGNQYGVGNPEWITNDRALVFGGAGSQISIDTLGGGDYSFKPWITPQTDAGDGELSRDGKRLVTTLSYGDDLRLVFWAVRGDVKTEAAPAWPDLACDSSRDAGWSDPSWSPDGTGLAAANSEGIVVFRFSALAADHCVASQTGVISPTGESPDWGPADPPAARYVAAGGPGGTGGGDGGGTGAPGGAGGPQVTTPGAPLVLTTKVRRSQVRGGLKVKVQVAAPGKVTVRLTRGGKPVAVRTRTVTRAGVTEIKLPRLSAARAAKVRGRTVTLVVTAGGLTTTAPLTVR